MGGMGRMGPGAGRTDAAAPATVLRFEPRPLGQARASAAVPTLLASRTRPDASKAVRRRRLVLNMGLGGMMGSGSGGGGLTLNGKPFHMKRNDETGKLGPNQIREGYCENT